MTVILSTVATPGLSLATLRQELKDRGFDYLSNARADRYVNWGYLELCEEELWPFLEATGSGTAPLTISDLGSIGSVTNTATNSKLHQSDRRSLVDAYTDLATTGTPSYYYLEGGNTIRTYPSGGTLSVRYWITPPQLSADADQVVVPLRFNDLILDSAVRRAYIDSDNYEAAQAVEAERQRGLQLMRSSLLYQNHDEPDIIIGASGEDW